MAKDPQALLLDAGDSLFSAASRPSEADLASARLMLDLYAEMGYRAVNIGYRDLPAGISFLREGASQQGVPLLSANLRLKDEAPFPPYLLLDHQGVTIAVLAVTAPILDPALRARGVHMLAPIPRLQELVPELAQKASLIILLSNLGYFLDRQIPAKVPGIDIIIGSGSGSPLYQPLQMEGTYLLRAHEKGKSVGRAEVLLDAEGRLSALEHRLVLLGDTLPEDQAVAAKVDELAGKLKPKPGPTPLRSVPPEENPFLKALKKKIEEQQAAGVTQAPARPRQPVDPKNNPLLELLRKLKEQQRQKPQAPKPAATPSQ